MPEVLEISHATLLRWRKEYRGMGEEQVKRLRQLEQENGRLTRALGRVEVWLIPP